METGLYSLLLLYFGGKIDDNNDDDGGDDDDHHFTATTPPSSSSFHYFTINFATTISLFWVVLIVTVILHESVKLISRKSLKQ